MTDRRGKEGGKRSREREGGQEIYRRKTNVLENGDARMGEGKCVGAGFYCFPSSSRACLLVCLFF